MPCEASTFTPCDSSPSLGMTIGSRLGSLRAAADLAIPKTVDRVVVHHPRRLHERVADRRSDEPEPPLLQILAHRVGLRRARRNVAHSADGVHTRFSADESPDVGIERARFLLH